MLTTSKKIPRNAGAVGDVEDEKLYIYLLTAFSLLDRFWSSRPPC